MCFFFVVFFILFVLFIYNGLVFIVGVVDLVFWLSLVFMFDMVFGVMFELFVSDLLIMVGLFCFFIEIFKVICVGMIVLFDYMFLVLVFVVYLVEFFVVL